MTTSPGAQRRTAPRRPRTALVVGGGVAGLTAARDLARAGLRVTLVEASDHFGGAVGAHEVAGLVLDSGAESFATRSDAVPDLLEELGLSDRVVTPHPAGSWLQLPEGAVPAPKSGVLGIPADPTAPELRKPLGRAGVARARMDRALPARVGAGERSIGGLVRARMGQRVLDRLVTPFVSGVYSTHPDELDVDAVAPGLRARLRELGSLGAAAGALRTASPAGANVAGLDGGMNLLSERLVRDAERLGVKLVTRYDVIALDRDPRRPGWMVIQRQPVNGDKTAVARGELLVMATDGPTTVRLLGTQVSDVQNFTPRSGPRIALATLVLDCPALDSAPRDTGLLVSDDVREVRAKALTHATAKWKWVAREAGEHRHVVRLSYGRATPRGSGPSPEVTLEDKHLISLALGDASTLLGVPIEPEQLVGADVVRWHTALPRTDAGHSARVTGFRRALKDVPDAAAVGAWLSGTGLAAVVADTRHQVRTLLKHHGFDVTPN
ncbi:MULTISPECIES: protoporphyrinogen oxidase [Kocuria]|uniref:protoporphyrinogen oxidase n=1 Tax=Kocuria TaxID=57493 RepID=UPI000BF22AEA|nr:MULTISPECIES: protoporphyrinogen oxidase [Kocuria]MDT0119344.1 protoporphyrinogen oxidase [Kocuria sp. PD6]QBJ21153.1 protoporphyrinogen oxidase [Kocuria indica]